MTDPEQPATEPNSESAHDAKKGTSAPRRASDLLQGASGAFGGQLLKELSAPTLASKSITDLGLSPRLGELPKSLNVAQDLMHPHKSLVKQAAASSGILDQLKTSSLTDRMGKMLEELRTPSALAGIQALKEPIGTSLPKIQKTRIPDLPRIPVDPVPGLMREQKETSALMLEALLAVKKAQEEAAAALQAAAKAQEEATSREAVREKRETARWWKLFAVSTGSLVATLISPFIPTWWQAFMTYFSAR